MIRKRCAIYTRKSTEEGLEQSFNSLDAQREACAAYILSQKHEGWAELGDRYDDGGFSGGSMERPGLQQLLEDVRAGRIDVIVVYKVDRLTRALSDFAKMVDVFDGAGVSFVSVTQAFNTTSSMGRLTLNVLLSFAQFEREVTAERIRDKVAASKRKGMWMGGAIPLGYDVEDKALVVSPTEATVIRTIFAEYLALGSVRQLRARLDALGIVSKQRTNRFGRVSGGTTFSRGALYNILRNPIYIGKVRHKEELHEGLHEAIIDDATWKLVQTQLADEIERVVMNALNERLADMRWLADQINGRVRETTAVCILRTIEQRVVEDDMTNVDAQSQDFLSIIDRIATHKDRLVVSLNLAAITEPETAHTPIPATFEIPFQKRQNGCAKPIIIAADNAPQQDPDLIALVADARRWASELLEGRASSIQHITEREGLRSGSVSRILALAWLAPDISTAILEGRQPPYLTAKTLRALPELPLDWAEQQRILGFA